MSRDHIIPRFILRGFAINPTENKKKHKIDIYDIEKDVLLTKKVDDVFAIVDFNSHETESFLANNYEIQIARIFEKIRNTIKENKMSIVLKDNDYKLLFRFLIIMWRRNDIHVNVMKQVTETIEKNLKNLLGEKYSKIINPEFQDMSLVDYFNENKEDISKKFYDELIQKTTDNDETVVKTIKHYVPYIIYNTSKVHFVLHNTFGTMRYMLKLNEQITSKTFPKYMIFPISKDLCICLLESNKQIDLNKKEYKISIEERGEDEFIIKNLIDNYITPTAVYFVVDETNIDIVRKHFNNK